MNVRRITNNDYGRLDASGGFLPNFCRNLRRWIEAGLVAPEDCYVFETEGSVAGGVCFCDDTEIAREILDYALLDAKAPDAPQALKKAAYMAANSNTESIGYNLYNDTDQYTDILHIFRQGGFRVIQTKKRYTYERDEPPQGAGALTYRSVAEVGEDVFVKAVEDVTAGTLDKLMATDAARIGGEAAAREYVDGLKKYDYNPEWWLLGYYGSKTIGLILPQRFDNENGGINYVGVVPEQRGQGYGSALLAEGTRILHESGIKKIYADIDTENFPLAAELEQVGYAFRMEENVLSYKF